MPADIVFSVAFGSLALLMVAGVICSFHNLR